MAVIHLSALPQGCSDEGLLFSESDIVLLFSFGSKFGKLICFFISWKTTVGWDPLQDYSSLAPSLASSSAFSFPGRPQWAGTHCRTIHLWLQVWQARPLFHFLEDRSGLGPTGGLFIFGSKFGKLVCFFISWKTAVGWYPLQDYSLVLCDLMKAFSETKESASSCRLQD